MPQPGESLAPDGLRDAEDDAADQRAPERAEAADDHGLEGEEQPDGPAADVKVVRMPRKTPATATMASDSAIASAVEPAVVDAHELGGLLVVGGRAEGAAERVRPIRSCRPTRSSTATPSMMSGNQPTASSPPREARGLDPARVQPRGSAENVSSRAFWMMIDRPKVTRSGGRIRCRAGG